MSVKAYLAHKMTGRTGVELVIESALAASACKLQGVTPIDPVVFEGVKSTPDVMTGGDPACLRTLWNRDKQMIRDAHVLIDLTGELKSEGVLHEIGYARYYLWKPVVRVIKGYTGPTISDFEDDGIVGSFWEAAELVQRRWGTRLKRIIWRARFMPKALVKWAFYQLQGWR
jgi:hypothetical protein